MFLIAMITGVIAYNYTGSLEEGKAFKTKAGIEKFIQSLICIWLLIRVIKKILVQLGKRLWVNHPW